MAKQDIDWFPLDPLRADFGATHGAYINGLTLLDIPGAGCSIVGHGTAATRVGAEVWARSVDLHGADRRISRKTLLSWKL